MQLTPELKQQLAEQKKQCVFCKLIAKEIPGKIVFEDEKTIALLDIYPAVKGHTLFLPKEHYPILPYMPEDDFTHFFSLTPTLTKAIKDSMVATAFNLFIASGGAAGQQAPHFMVHCMPREQGDGFFNFLFTKKGKLLDEEPKKVLVQNVPLALQRSLKRSNPSKEQPIFLQKVYAASTVLYEDDQILCVLPHSGTVPGHIQLYSKKEEKYLEKLSAEDSVYFFMAASVVASLLFEALKAQGTNIILKSGVTDDNPDGKLCLHILPRKQDDSLQSLLWQPQQPKYNLDGVMEKIKDKMWKVKYREEKKEVPKAEKNLSTPLKIKIPEKEKPIDAGDEIRAAIERIKK